MKSNLFRLVLAALPIVSACKATNTQSEIRSITDDSYKGTKLFVAWAANLPGDLENSLVNQTRFDVSHMQQIFSREWGGGYKSQALLELGGASKSGVLDLIRSQPQKHNLDSESMYFQYSASHGMPEGLVPDLIKSSQVEAEKIDPISFDEIASAILDLPSKEVIIFTMACHSGGLIKAIQKHQDRLNEWQREGRAFFIMTSSAHDLETSGLSKDKGAETINVEGSAGSPFGAHLWQAMQGGADGYGPMGVVDSKVTLAEIRDYMMDKVRADNQLMRKVELVDGVWKHSGQTELQVPVYFGFNYENLHMTGLAGKSAPSPSEPSEDIKETLKRLQMEIGMKSFAIEELRTKLAVENVPVNDPILREKSAEYTELGKQIDSLLERMQNICLIDKDNISDERLKETQQCFKNKKTEIEQINQKMLELDESRRALLKELKQASETNEDNASSELGTQIQSASKELQAKYLELYDIIAAELERRKRES